MERDRPNLPAIVGVLFGRQPLLFEAAAYAWFIFMSALDVMLTWIVLHAGGTEVNPIAQTIIERGDLWGVLIFKFALATVVILACEQIGRQKLAWGKNLAHAAVAITAIPVVLSLLQLLLARPHL